MKSCAELFSEAELTMIRLEKLLEFLFPSLRVAESPSPDQNRTPHTSQTDTFTVI